MTAKNGNISLIVKLALALAVVAVLVFAALQRLSDTAVVAPVTRGKAVNAVPGSVVVKADKGGIRELKSEAPGRVASCDGLVPGARFQKDDLLLKLDSSELEREIAETTRNFKSAQAKRELLLKANVELAVVQESLTNAERLLKRGDVSEESVRALRRSRDAIESKLAIEEFDNEKARADYDALMDSKQIQLKKMSIVATEDGVVKDVVVWKGALINTGSSVATILSNERLVEAQISEENFGSIRLGQPAKVRLLIYPGEAPFDAKVSKILSVADEATQRYTVYLAVTVDPARLIHGSSGQVTITVDERANALLIPRRALFSGGNVFVVKDGRVQLRQVELGYVSLSAAEVKRGLAEGELVIVENIDQFRDGQRVRVPAAK